jgi:amphi-Trp domain-containing protein
LLWGFMGASWGRLSAHRRWDRHLLPRPLTAPNVQFGCLHPGGALPPARTLACMDLVEIKQKERVRREEAAERLRMLADQLSRHNDVEFERDGISFKVRVPDEVQLKIEFEVEDDGSELEVELTW